MQESIKSQFERADELLAELEAEYQRSLTNKEVTKRAENISQEVLLKLNNILDQVMHAYYDKKVAPILSDKEKNEAKVYFPIVGTEHGLLSTLGKGKMVDLSQSDSNVFSFLQSSQPYFNKSNKWLELLHKYAVERHIRLTPQKKTQQRTLTMSSAGAHVSIGEGAMITLGNGAKISIGGKEIMGGQTLSADSKVVYCDPDLDIKKEIWVSFNFEGTDINALGLCKECVQKTKELVDRFAKLF